MRRIPTSKLFAPVQITPENPFGIADPASRSHGGRRVQPSTTLSSSTLGRLVLKPVKGRRRRRKL